MGTFAQKALSAIVNEAPVKFDRCRQSRALLSLFRQSAVCQSMTDCVTRSMRLFPRTHFRLKTRVSTRPRRNCVTNLCWVERQAQVSVSCRHEPNCCVVRFLADCGVVFQEPLSTFVDADGAVRVCALVIIVRTQRWRSWRTLWGPDGWVTERVEFELSSVLSNILLCFLCLLHICHP